jgi:hypothetical protein
VDPIVVAYDRRVVGNVHMETSFPTGLSPALRPGGRVAEHLLTVGAELNGTPSWGESTPLDAADSLNTARELFVNWLKEHGAIRAPKASD